MARSFKDAVVVITGAAGGIGLATARAFAAEGARVHLADLRDQVHLEAQAMGGSARGHQVDVTDAQAVAELAQAVLAAEGRVDVLINNAGVCQARPMGQLTFDDWRLHLDVNLWGVIHGIHAFLPAMRERGQGHIVNVASMAGLLPFPAVAPYCASKFAVVGLSESLSAELAPAGIKVTVVCPGAVRTGLLDQARRDMTGVDGQAVVRLFDLTCTSPENQAADIVAAVRNGRTLQLNPGFMLPLYLLQKTSRRLYNGLWALTARAIGRRMVAKSDSEN